MGAILAGIIQGLGQHAQQQNEQNILAQVKANGDMAQLIEKQAAAANTPQDQIELMQLAAKYRALGAKKPSKDMDLHNIFQQKNAAMIQQASQQQQQQNSLQAQQKAAQIQQAQGTVAQGTGLTPPGPDNVQGTAGGMSQGAQVPTGLQGLAPPNPTSAAGAPPPAASAPTPSPQSQAGAPPPVSGLPSPGFNTVAPTNSPSLGPGEFVSPSGDTMGRVLRAPFRTPEQQQEFEARGKGLEAMAGVPARIAEYKAMYGAQSEAQIALLEAKWRQAQQFLKQMQASTGNSGAHYAVKLGASGPEVTEDAGTPLPRVYLGTSLPKGIQIEGDEPLDPKQTYTILRYKDGTRTATPVATPQVTGGDISGNAVQYSRYVPGSAEAAGAVLPSLAAPKTFNMQGGGVGMASAGQLQAGGAPTAVPGAIGTGAPVISTLNVPGQFPQTTTRVKGVAAAGGLPAPRSANANKPAPSTNPAAPNAAVAAAADNSPIAVNYRNWVAGKATLSDKEQTAARQYAASHGLPTPNILDANAQKSIAAINPILEEIVHARQLLREKGLIEQPELESKLAMTKAFLKYKAGFTDPLTKAISDLSFDRIRSVGQALQGTGSRAYPIFQLGLEHTPMIGLNSDSAKMMDNKLEGMERRARESIAAAMSENKSGVAPQLQAPGVTPPAAAMPAGVPQVGDQFGSGKVVHIQRVQ